jgi:hypothetical protein
MSEDEGFLARWSRLKREQAVAPSRRDDAQAPPGQAPGEHAPPQIDEPLPPVDLASLPPIESMGAGSDISAYLGVGVPLELTKAALRSAWRADPAVRNFVEIADNQWDFNTPDAIPGFGALGAVEESKALIARAMTGAENVVTTITSLKSTSAGDPPDSQTPTVVSLEDSRVIDRVWQVGTVAPLNTAPPPEAAPTVDAVLQVDTAPPLDAAPLLLVEQTAVEIAVAANGLDPGSSGPGRRGHGSALPR